MTDPARPATLIEISNAILEAVRIALPDFREVNLHSGQIRRETITDFRKASPAALLTHTLLDDWQDDGEGVQVRAHFMLLLATAPSGSGRDRLDEHAVGGMAAAALLLAIRDWRLGYGVGAAEGVRINDLTDPKDRRHTDAVRMMEWSHTFKIWPEPTEYRLDQLHVGLAPNIGPDHIDDYVTLIRPEAGS